MISAWTALPCHREPFGGAPELVGDACERGDRGLRPVDAGILRRLGEREGRADRDPAADGKAREHALAHGRSAIACSSARRMNTVDVAPGS